MKGILKIQNAVFYAYHGVMTEEQNLGRKFEVDVELEYDFTKSSRKQTNLKMLLIMKGFIDI